MKRAAALLLAAAALPAAADQALLLTIGDYAGDVPALPGVQRDRENARRIARALGFGEGTLGEAADGALGLAGLQQQFKRLAERVQPGERVFVYFSGHGTSREAGGRCEQALLAHDGRPWPAAQVAQALAAVSAKAGEVLMMVDACFSGGLAGAAALRGAGDAFRPKFARGEGADRCEQPVNFVPALTRSLRGAVNLERNHAVLAAARDDEFAFDHAQHGGLATAAVAACLDAAAPPATLAELAACAQGGVEKLLPADPRLRAQHLTVGGAAEMKLATVAAANAAPAQDRLAALLARADPGWPVRLAANATTLRIGRDELALTVSSERGGYVTLLYAGSDGRTLATLYPTPRDGERYVGPEAPLVLPRRWRAQGPAGRNRLLAVVAPQPLSLADLQAGRGPFGAALLVVEEAD